MNIIRVSLFILAGLGFSAGVAVSQQDWNSGCLNIDPEACGEAIWQSYAGADPVGNALNGSIDDVIGGGFDHKTPEEIAACIQKCKDHRDESIAACRMVYGLESWKRWRIRTPIYWRNLRVRMGR